MDCPYIEKITRKSQLCIFCKHFIIEYRYGYAKEDPSYVVIRCDIDVEDIIKTLEGKNSLRKKWNLTQNIGWGKKEFLELIAQAQDCGFYEEEGE